MAPELLIQNARQAAAAKAGKPRTGLAGERSVAVEAQYYGRHAADRHSSKIS
jgi:hypothetical protein